MASAGRNSARGIVGLDDHGSHQAGPIRPVRQAHRKMLALRKMQRDIATIVDISALEPRALQHRAENFFGDCAFDRRHRRDELLGGKWRHRRMHAARDVAVQ